MRRDRQLDKIRSTIIRQQYKHRKLEHQLEQSEHDRRLAERDAHEFRQMFLKATHLIECRNVFSFSAAMYPYPGPETVYVVEVRANPVAQRQFFDPSIYSLRSLSDTQEVIELATTAAWERIKIESKRALRETIQVAVMKIVASQHTSASR